MAKSAAAPAVSTPAFETADLPIQDIDRSLNYRKTYDQAELDAMAESITAQGVIQPVVVRPGVIVEGDPPHRTAPWLLVAGERRIRASIIAGRTTIPAVIRRDLDDASARVISLIENLQRKDVDPLEEADGFRELHEKQGWPVARIADSVGQTKGYVYARIRLCSLTASGRKLYADKRIDVSTAVLIARIPNATLQDEAVKEFTSYGRHVRYEDAHRLISERYMLRLAGAPFELDDAKLVPAAGSCAQCPKRTGNQGELFADVKATDTCTDPICYRGKSDAAWTVIAAKAEQKGQKIVPDKVADKLFMHGGDRMVWDAPFVDMAAECHEDAKGRKYKQLVSKDTTIHLVRDPTGKVHHLVARAELAMAMKGSGVALGRSSSTGSTHREDGAAERRKQQRRRAVTVAAIDAVIKAAVGGDAFWRLLLDLMMRGGYSNAVTDTVKRRGWVVAKGERASAVFELEARSLVRDDLPRLVLELLISNSAYFTHSDGIPESLTMAAEAFGVDVKKITKAAGAEFDAAQRAKTSKKGGK